MDRRDFCSILPLLLTGCGGGSVEYPPFLLLGQEQFPGRDFVGLARLETWLPTFTFGTPGDLTVVYSRQRGRFFLLEEYIFISGALNLIPTYTTGSGEIRIGGFPRSVHSELMQWAGVCWVSGPDVTWPTGRTQATLNPFLASTYGNIMMTGSAVAQIVLAASNIPSGGTFICTFAAQYRVE